MKIEQLLKNMKKLHQVQYSLIDQLYQLENVAKKLDLSLVYDYIHNITNKYNDFNNDITIELVVNNWSNIEKEEIHEGTLKEQCIALMGFAAKFGLYDAYDFLRKVIQVC